MITKDEAQKAVERRARDAELAAANAADAKLALADAKTNGDWSDRERYRLLVNNAEARLRHEQMEETRAREALADAQRVLDAVAANEAAFDRLADYARRIIDREAALAALGEDVCERVAAELAALQADIQAAAALWRDVSGHILPVLHLLTPATPGTLSPRWGGVVPGRDDLLRVLADARRAARGGK
jgi:hypothetical protein